MVVKAYAWNFEKKKILFGGGEERGMGRGGSVDSFQIPPGCHYGFLPHTEQPPEPVITL